MPSIKISEKSAKEFMRKTLFSDVKFRHFCCFLPVCRKIEASNVGAAGVTTSEPLRLRLWAKSVSPSGSRSGSTPLFITMDVDAIGGCPLSAQFALASHNPFAHRPVCREPLSRSRNRVAGRYVRLARELNDAECSTARGVIFYIFVGATIQAPTQS